MKLIYLSFFFLLIVSINLAQNYGNWYITNPMNEKRSEHAGIVLNDGNILVSGTNGSPHPLATCEIFDVKEQKWKYISSMNTGRMYHTLVNFKDGRIMAIGGWGENSCEILDKDYSKWVITDSLKTKRLYGQTTTLLNDGRVLLVGGQTSNETLKECEIYNPQTQKWEITEDLDTVRVYHTATLLNDGRVLVVGGTNLGKGYYSSCKIFDPVTNKWNAAASMNYVRANHSATLLPDGKVIVLGGRLKKVEIYDPLKDTWEVVGETAFIIGRNKALSIKNGEYLVAVEGQDGPGWEVFSLTNFQSVVYKRFETAEYEQVFLKINEDNLLLAGGLDEIYGFYGMMTNKCKIFDFNLTDVNEEVFLNKSSEKPQLSCYPNPFNNSTNINIEIDKTSFISLILYNAIGEEVKRIFEGDLDKGNHIIQFNAIYLSSGIYFLTLRNKEINQIFKLIYQK